MSLPLHRAPWALAALVVVFSSSCNAPSASRSAAASADPYPLSTPLNAGAAKVGPPRGSLLVIGGGSQGPEVFAKFIELAGGPDALILDVPTAGGDSVYPADWRGQNGLRAAGARNVKVLHTKSRTAANSDEFLAPFKEARGVWFEGGRHFHLVDAYLGTKTEALFHDVLARGGVIAGSSAGASIQGSFLVRGAPSNNNLIMAHPQYMKGFAFLRGVGVDQHVVARERLADLADSLMRRFPDTLFISEDEGTAWLVQGDYAEIIGRSKAFVYNGRDATDKGKPFLTLNPGDAYDLAARRLIRRANHSTALSQAFVDGLFADFMRAGGPMATIVVAQAGKVLINSAYNVPPQPKYMPETTMPNFALGEIGDALRASVFLASMRAGAAGRGGGGRGGRGGAAADSTPPAPATPLTLASELAPGVTVRDYLAHAKPVADGPRRFAALVSRHAGQSFAQLVNARVGTPVGMRKTAADSTGAIVSNVDELYRFELGLQANRNFTDADGISVFAPVDGAATGNALGWRVDRYNGALRQAAYGTSDGKRAAFVRFPEQRLAIIILTNSDRADVKRMAERMADRLR